MARAIPATRLVELIEVATRTFVARGYRLTQMSDVAESLGVAKGTLYGYVESKEALFDVAVRYADEGLSVPGADMLPFRTPSPGETIRFIQSRMMEEAKELELAKIVFRTEGEQWRRGDFERSVRDLYRRLKKNRQALKLIDRCAVDHPDLAKVFFEQGRYAQVSLLASLLERGIAAGAIRELPNLQLSARMVLETIALWAIHMPWDAAPRVYEPEELEREVVELLVNAYGKVKNP